MTSELERLAGRRQAIWRGAEPEPGEVERLGRRLADLYEERRIERASGPTGPTRAEIMHRARIAVEIDRLGSG